ncbi:MAG: molybdopterin dehydrogenase, partial [Gammaproteobacteria bacterium]|nr:molybdopterin dehydrogenase [Gammaproteobacteria bacterium]
QRAFIEAGAAQCGICTPGMIMAALTLGRRPSRRRIQQALAGNLCRCTGYEAIYRAIQAAAARPEPAPATTRRGAVERHPV